ncbi:hypothetical protein ABZ707_06315 [Streptomyces sp. NPDC006923]|uniref:hypothetical protein n=1 Tax=Streptomyces sp. NPDC006923 TaxID=3155355 RepID=UPI0033C9733D
MAKDVVSFGESAVVDEGCGYDGEAFAPVFMAAVQRKHPDSQETALSIEPVSQAPDG